MSVTSKFNGRLAVSYLRVSSDEQEKEGFSIPAQRKLLEKYAADHGFKIVEEFTDIETAKRAGRVGFNAMVTLLKKQAKISNEKKRCFTILVEKTDRLYRNLKDYVTLDGLELDIHFVKENVVLSPDSHSSEKFMHGIKVLMARQYVDNLSEEVKKGMREKAEQGLWPSKAPTGYKNADGPDGKKIVVHDPESAAIIKRMFERYATGKYSLEQVGEMAEGEGLVMKKGKNKRSTIQYLFKNPFYYGDFLFKKKMYKGVHEPLVSRQVWDQVQEARSKRRNSKSRKSTKRDFAFSRLISCGHCGCALVGELRKGKYIYYHCTYYKGKCNEPYAREELLEEKFTEILRRLQFDDEILNWVRHALLDSQADEQKFRESALKRLQSQYSKVQQRIDAMYIDKLDGKIDLESYERRHRTWREEQERLLDSMKEHQLANESYTKEGVMLLELATRAADLFEKQPASEKRRLLDFVLSNCTWAGGKLTPEYRQPFDIIADMATECASKKAAGMSSNDLCQAKLPRPTPNATFFYTQKCVLSRLEKGKYVLQRATLGCRSG